MAPRITKISALFYGFFISAFLLSVMPRTPGMEMESVPSLTPPVLKVPAEHPRIFFNRADVEEFKKRTNGVFQIDDDGRDAYKTIRENAFAYLISDDTAAAAKAIDAALALASRDLGDDPHRHNWPLFHIALCYDWCYPILGPAKEQMARTLIRAMDEKGYRRNMNRGAGSNMTPDNSLSPMAAGLALYGEHPNAEQWMRDARKLVVDECLGTYLNILCPDGGDFEGTQYHGRRHIGISIWAWIWLKGTGENLFTAEQPHLMNGINWWIYLLKPHLAKTHVTLGDMNNPGILDRNVTAAACVALGADDPYAAWYANYGGLSGWEAVALRPREIKAPAEGMPLHKFFRMGMAVIRSGWDIGPGSSDTLFTFMCRDYMQGWHCHNDVNHFTISRKGRLAIKSGHYDGNSLHSRNYNRRTVAHNSMLVYDPLEPLPLRTSPQDTPQGDLDAQTSRDGGQVFHNNTAFNKRAEAPRINWETYDCADFRAFGVGDGYYYMCGDATKAYNLKDFRKVEHFTREIVYVSEVNPPVIVIFDRVVATKPSSKKTWLLHTIREPKVTGNTVTVRESDGQLTIQSLLPRNPVLSLVGGPGKQYWVDDPGMNYDAGSDPNDKGWRGNWRIEISPSARVAEDLFLTVLYPCDPGAPAPISKLLESDGKAGCEITVAGKTFRMLFNTSGNTGGTFNGAPFSTTDPNRAK